MSIALPAFVAGMVVMAILIFGSLFLWAARQVERHSRDEYADQFPEGR